MIDFGSERLRDGRLTAMERRIEARDLRQVGPSLQQHPDRREIVRLMQRRQRHVLVERLDDRRVDAHRGRELEAAVHDTMPDAHHPMHGEMRLQKAHQVIERPGVADVRAVAPRLFVDDAVRAVARDEAR